MTSDMVQSDVTILPRWGPELRRTVMKVQPAYFSWPPAQRERYGLLMQDDEYARLERALCFELFGRGFARRRRKKPGAERMTLAEQNIFNAAILPFAGIGEDSFFLNDHLADGKTVLDFETVRAYDEWDYRNQQVLRKQENPAWDEKPYRGSLYLQWARLFVDGAFTYATLSMAAGYLYSELQSASIDIVQARIPHRYVSGPNDGRVEGKMWQWDQRLDAGGQEGILEALNEQVFHYEQSRHDTLLNAWAAQDRGGVYLLDTSEPNEKNVHFVFTDPRAIERIRFRSFLTDCRAIERPAAELQKALAEEHAALVRFIEAAHKELLRTFDPKVTRLRKRRRIMVHKHAFDDLA